MVVHVDNSQFPLRGVDEPYERWCHRLVAHIRLLEQENEDLRETLRDMERFMRDVNRLQTWLEKGKEDEEDEEDE